MTHDFPPSFLFGTATSATQVEGHCTTSDWWHFAKDLGRVKDGDVPHPACDMWNRFEDDIALQRQIGANAYRMSIEWARIEPSPGEFDPSALERYREMLGALRDATIEPMVTLHHFTLPRWMSQRGGVLSPCFAEYFERFTRKAVEHLGDLVPRWITLNEPNVVASLGYFTGMFPPGRRDALQAVRAHEALLDAHVRGYRAVHSVAERHGWNVEVGVAHHLRIAEPQHRSNPADRIGTYVFDTTFNDSFSNALCGIPLSLAERTLLAASGTRRIDARGTQDFFGLNYYGRFWVHLALGALGTQGTQGAQGAHGAHGAPARRVVRLEARSGAEVSDLGWEVFPEGLGGLLRKWSSVSGLPIYVTENGIADARDVQRPSFLVRHLAQVADALRDGVDIRGYFHWSLLDNFEWAEGYGPRFGLYEVDYSTQTRTPRPSAGVFRRIAQSRSIEDSVWEEHGRVPEQAWRAG